MSVTDAFKKKIDAMTTEQLRAEVGELTVKVERARMRFSKNRSTANSEAFARRRSELGHARTMLTLR